jgi:hypothetical protein
MERAEKSVIAWSNASLWPSSVAIATGSPDRACVRARVQPQMQA